ncbi:DUF1513 domain-containing protein [Sulfitobacter sp. S0837]|uniref:DUF1513 domain-containing protein n=1 Tax=Sulfitobacter maritimus TaxID=2741719 RepID=UPI001583FB2F|nr:DUF1513 domain-containing protein [Sulfitobacter maritimus]NUH67146.1 DUF1513 domain-containing protein [Sulfitobacter maritimus]
MPSRRHFLAGLAALSLPRPSWADVGNPAFLAAAREPNGRYALFGLDPAGRDLFRIALPKRGHAATAHPTAPEAVAFARRPGRFALVIDCLSGSLRHQLDAPSGRHFYGHGAFLNGGEILATSENDIDSGTGRIGLWSRSRGYARIGEIPSGGVGPHEIRAWSDDILAVANGGIRTHPDRGREKLNLETMRPNLSYLKLDGTLLDQVELAPEWRQSSIRHLALAPDGQVAFAMQWQGAPGAAGPLLGLHRRGSRPVLAEADLVEQLAMDGYAGSVAYTAHGDAVGITSPRGGRLHVFDTEGQFKVAHRRADICGLAPGAEGFVATDGLGGLLRGDMAGLSPLGRADRAWDNHLVALGG